LFLAIWQKVPNREGTRGLKTKSFRKEKPFWEKNPEKHDSALQTGEEGKCRLKAG